jgi:hypothetical protein
MAETLSEKDPATAKSSTDASPAGGDESGRLAGARQSAAEAYQAARERTAAFYGSARDGARGARRSAAEGLEANPIAVLVGGLALGALAAALLPSTRREREMFGPVGRRINDTAREAARAARDAGREQLDDFTDRAMEAVRASAGTAAETVRGEGKD